MRERKVQNSVWHYSPRNYCSLVWRRTALAPMLQDSTRSVPSELQFALTSCVLGVWCHRSVALASSLCFLLHHPSFPLQILILSLLALLAFPSGNRHLRFRSIQCLRHRYSWCRSNHQTEKVLLCTSGVWIVHNQSSRKPRLHGLF